MAKDIGQRLRDMGWKSSSEKKSTSDGYMPKMTYKSRTVKEGDTRYNSTTKRNERYSPEGKWVAISSRTVVKPTENKTDRAKEWGVGQK